MISGIVTDMFPECDRCRTSPFTRSSIARSCGSEISSGVAGFSPDAASLYLKPGDVMEAEIEGIGVLRNPVISWQEGHGEPAPPRVRW